MKIFATILGLAVAIALAAVLWPRGDSKFQPEISLSENVAAETAPRSESAKREETKTEVAAAPAQQPAAPANMTPPATSTAAADPPTPADASLKRVGGDQLEIDGRYTVLGSGTELDPYRITWELLQSAYETMDLNGPRDTPPKRLSMLNGTWVQISGYLAPPLWGQETSELLVMLNRWDGCCVGLPPTPFDCIEAELVTPMRLGAKHSISFGTIRGRLIVEPFRAGSFLIGLYRLESAQTDNPKDR